MSTPPNKAKVTNATVHHDSGTIGTPVSASNQVVDDIVVGTDIVFTPEVAVVSESIVVNADMAAIQDEDPRLREVVCGVTGKTFPAPAYFDDVTPFDESDIVKSLFSRVT